MKKIPKFLTLLFLIGTITALSVWLIARQVLIMKAEEKAAALADTGTLNTPDEKISALARETFKRFHHQDPGEIPLYRLRSYLTNSRLPSWFRLPDGVMETLLEKGYCDNAARMLAFALRQENINSIQWNMISPGMAHSALLVRMPDNREILADPFYGYITTDAPVQAQARLKKGEEFSDVFMPLGPQSNPAFYKAFADMSMAAAGQDLRLESTLPPLHGKPLILGTLDGSDLDVKQEGANKNLTPFWHYAGHKYNREWVRVLKTSEPVTITMDLLDAPDDTSFATPAPDVTGKTLTWTLQPGDTLTFRDGAAKFSFQRLNSYIGIDRITITPAAL